MFSGQDFIETSPITCLNINIMCHSDHCDYGSSLLNISCLLLLSLLLGWFILLGDFHIVSSTIRASLGFSLLPCCLRYLPVCLCFFLSSLAQLCICLNYRHNIDQTVITHLCLINLIHKGLQSCCFTSGGLNTRSHHRQYDNTTISILSVIYMISQG